MILTFRTNFPDAGGVGANKLVESCHNPYVPYAQRNINVKIK